MAFALGDTLYRASLLWKRLPGNTTATLKVLTQTGTGVVSAAPAWQAVSAIGAGTVTNTGTLTANQLVLGNGGVDIKPLGSLGTTTTVYHGNAAGAGSFAKVTTADFTSANVSQWTNDAAYATPTSATAFTNKTGNISQWTNDSGYLTSSFTGSTNIVTLGTVSTGTWSATAIGATKGGTGQTVYVVGDLLQASSTTALSTLAAVATGNVLLSGGVGTVSAWGKVGLATHVSGNLPVTNLDSGTGATSSTFWRGDGTWAAAGTGSVTSVALTVPTFLSISGSPITTSGTLAITLSGTALPVANGGTGATSASITAFNNITGFSAAGTTGTTSTNLVFSTSPTLTTPALGVATATSINGNTLTTGTWTLTGAAAKVLTFNNSLTLAGTDSTTMTFPATSATIARTDAANTFTGASTGTSWNLTTPVITTNFTFGNGQGLFDNGADTIEQYRSTNAQRFSVYNTRTDASNYERLDVYWTSNVATIGVNQAGTGNDNRSLVIQTEQGVASSSSITLKPGSTGGVVLNGRGSLRMDTGLATTSATVGGVDFWASGNVSTAASGTSIAVSSSPAFSPSSTSTLIATAFLIRPTINYSAVTPGAGNYEALAIRAVETALPTGTNYLIRTSAGTAGTTDKFTVTNGGNVAIAGTLVVTGATTVSAAGFATGIFNNGSGFKHARTTTGSVAIGSTALVTVTWSTAFADANYTVTVDVVDSTTTSLSLSVVHIESVSASAITVRVLNNSAISALTGTLQAIAVHD